MCVLPVSSPWLFLPRLSVCVGRVSVFSVLLSVFLLVYLCPLSLSLSHIIKWKIIEEEEEEKVEEKEDV